MYSTLLLEISGNLATVTLNRPEKRNAISTQMMAELQTALDQIEKSHARVAILTGSGKAFCAGMDLDMLAAIAKQSPAENQEDSRRIAKMFRRIWSFPRPLIAAVNGPAYAGGCGIATLCDFTLAVPEAKFGYTEVKIGFLPAIVSVFLTRQIANGPYHRSGGGETIRPGIGNCSRRALDGTRARTCKPADRGEPQQPHAFQTPSGLLGGRRRGSRSGTRHPGKRPHSLHTRFSGRACFVSGEAQAGVAGRL